MIILLIYLLGVVVTLVLLLHIFLVSEGEITVRDLIACSMFSLFSWVSFKYREFELGNTTWSFEEAKKYIHKIDYYYED